MLDRVQLETGGIGKEGLNMARGSSHLPLTIEHFWHSMFWVPLSDQTCTEVAGEPITAATQPLRRPNTGPPVRPHRNIIPAAPSPRAAASRIRNTPASRGDITIRSTLRRWPRIRTRITVHGSSAAGAVRPNPTPRRLHRDLTGPHRRPIARPCRVVRDAASEARAEGRVYS
jgi:hypothetical protein